ncbi:MAG: amidophosphoribosyltransferase, partial [Phycisphaerae bacterium]
DLQAHAGDARIGGASGHNRYATAGGSLACNAQPLLTAYVGGQVALGHNGNLINAELLSQHFEQAGHLFQTTSDTEVIIHLLASPLQQKSPDPLAAALRHLQGAFSLVFLFPDRIEAARDPWGWRPLVLGMLPGGGHIVASETVALDVVGATLVREIEPGEIVTISARGVESRRFAGIEVPAAHCVFEHVYFANPASNVFGQNVQMAREALGARLAKEAPVAADFVMPMPDSGRSAAAGYAQASGLAYREGIVPNRYVGRTFIKPTQTERIAAVRLKLNVIAEIVRGKRVVVVDDSIVRGTTTKAKMDQIRQAGAKEIHLRISCPPIRHPCYFGVDFATRDQLIAHGKSIEDVRK